MTGPVKPLSRPYHAPQRAAAAARTREAIVTAAKDAFERLGCPGATMRGIADQAGVSVKTVEALYRTKAELRKHVVDYAIPGDLRPRQVTDIAERSAQVFWVVEQAAPADPDIAGLWAQMTDNRRFGARWAATTLLGKPGLPPHVGERYAEEVFWLAIDPGTYRSLTLGRGLNLADFETWIRNFYDKMLLH